MESIELISAFSSVSQNGKIPFFKIDRNPAAARGILAESACIPVRRLEGQAKGARKEGNVGALAWLSESLLVDSPQYGSGRTFLAPRVDRGR